MDKQNIPDEIERQPKKRGQNRSSSKFERKSCSAQVNSFSIPLMQMHRRRIPKAPPLLLLHMAPQRIAPTECLSTPSNHQHPVVLEHLPGVSAGSPSRATFGVRGSHDNNRKYRAGVYTTLYSAVERSWKAVVVRFSRLHLPHSLHRTSCWIVMPT